VSLVRGRLPQAPRRGTVAAVLSDEAGRPQSLSLKPLLAASEVESFHGLERPAPAGAGGQLGQLWELEAVEEGVPAVLVEQKLPGCLGGDLLPRRERSVEAASQPQRGRRWERRRGQLQPRPAACCEAGGGGLVRRFQNL